MQFRYLSVLGAALTLLVANLPANAQWIDSNVLADDPRAYCSDIVAANRQTNRVSTQSSGQNASESINHRERSGGGRFSFAGFGIGGNGRSMTHQENRNSNSSSSAYSHDHSTVTNVAAGRNCDAFVQGAAHVEATRIQADVNRDLIESRERVNLQELETNSQNQLFQMMMQGF